MKLSAFVGLRAIGWVVTEGTKVVAHGLKKVNIPFDNYYEYLAGLPVSKRINRRMKRQTRRNLWRYKSRRRCLKTLLNNNGYACEGEMSREQVLHLRVKGLTERLNNEELYMVLMALQQKRGYKRLRGSGDAKAKSYTEEISRHQSKMDEVGADRHMATLYPNETARVLYNEEQLKKYRSIAEYLLTLASSTDLIFNRTSYETEFDTIMAAQALPEGLTGKIRHKIYYQRPLKKGKIGTCDYETNRTVTHASNPMYQQFRIWRDVNNIVIYDGQKTELEITFELRQKWVQKLRNGATLTKAQCCKDLGHKHSKEFTWFSGNVIAGNPVIGAFLKIDVCGSYDHPIPIAHALDVWADLIAAVDDEDLSLLLKKKYAFTDYQVNELLDLDLHSLGYADFSTKAIKKLLPHLWEGKKLKEAILQVYGKVDFKNVALRNVVLEQHFHSYQSLVTAISKRHNITELQFEIDHFLKQGNKGRKAIAQQKRKDEKWLKENAAVLAGRSQYDILKYKLWQECKGQSVYEPGKEITLPELFSEAYNLDHIVAKSTLFETGVGNMVIAPVALNEKKDRKTGYDFATETGAADWYQTVAETFSDSKKRMLLMRGDEIPTDWLSRRQNSDYNTKCFATVNTGPGMATNIPNKLLNKYLKEWGMNVYTDQDARLFLCKAWVMANMSQETVQRFNNIQLLKRDVYKINPTIDAINLERVKVYIPRTKYVRKTTHGFTPRFALHGESVFGKRTRRFKDKKGEWQEEVFYKIRQPIGKLTPNMVENIMDKPLRLLIQQRIDREGDHTKGILSMAEEPILFLKKPVKNVSVAVNANKVYPLHSTDGKGNKGGKNVYERKIDFVYSDKSRLLKLWVDDNGKVCKQAITLMDWVDMLNAGLEAKYKYPECMTLQENDMVELRGTWYYVIGTSEDMSLRPVTTLSATETYKVKAGDWKKMVKLHVNQLGLIGNCYGLREVEDRKGEKAKIEA